MLFGTSALANEVTNRVMVVSYRPAPFVFPITQWTCLCVRSVSLRAVLFCIYIRTYTYTHTRTNTATHICTHKYVHKHTHTQTLTDPCQLVSMSGAESVWYKDLSALREIVDFAINSGLIIKPSAELRDATAAVTIGLCLTPSHFPRELFSLGCDIQPALNLMIDTISRDHSFLATALEKSVYCCFSDDY